ncbi:MAG: inactive transglutaminase family protein [Kistimonas sp.]|nr:inactive transglutaminase family protein [Kistimonas sp.]
MTNARNPLLFLLAALALLTFAVVGYKHFVLGFPLLPGEQTQVWDVEAQVSFRGTDKPARASLAMPEPGAGFDVLDTTFVSPGYGFRKVRQHNVDRAEWTRRNVSGKQTLYYKIKIRKHPYPALEKVSAHTSQPPSPEDAPYLPALSGAHRVAADQLILEARQQSADDISLASLLIQGLNQSADRPDAAFLGELTGGNGTEPTYTHTQLVMRLLQDAGLQVRFVSGVALASGRRGQPVVEMLEVHTGHGWHMLDPRTGQQGVPENFLPWQRGGVSLLDVDGGENSRVTFSALSRSVPSRDLAIAAGRESHAALVDFSLYSLPVEEQNAYRYILLLPIGTLVVAIMRILVGIRTSGTFMPVLMALAFLQTRLLPGLVIFTLIVSIGLWIRFILSRLNLLLTARIASVVTVVIGIMAGTSIISYKLGIQQALSVTFFPTIILAWTVERMSVLWEEEGPGSVLLTGGGSLLIATISYFLMTNRLIEHLTFTFPELLLLVLGLTLMLGRYTGYRLLELRRFRGLATPGKET